MRVRNILITLILLFAVTSVGQFGTTLGVASAEPNNMTVALMIDSYYIDNWQSLTYPDFLAWRSLVSAKYALDYLGIQYDIVDETISQTELNKYGALIVVAGENLNSNTYPLVSNYTETLGKDVLVIYPRYGEKAYRTNLGFVVNTFIDFTDTSLLNTSYITEGLVDSYGSLVTWNPANYTFNYSISNFTIYLADSSDFTAAYLFSAEHNGGTYIFLQGNTGNWMSGKYSSYFPRLILNYVKHEIPNLVRVTQHKSANNATIILRADDYAGMDSNWQAFADTLRKFTWAYIPNSTTEDEFDDATAYGVDLVPHGWAHEDWSVLTLEDANTLAQQVKERHYDYTGKYPTGMVMPYNEFGRNASIALASNGYKWATVAAPKVRNLGIYHYFSLNSTWEFGSYNDYGDTVSEFVQRLIDQERPGMLIYHPYQYNNTELQAAIDEVHQVLDNYTSTEGIDLCTLSEYLNYIALYRDIRVNNTHIIVNSATVDGLTLEINGTPSGKTLKVGDNVILYRKGDRFVLPKLDAGVYDYSFVDSDTFPVITVVDAGLSIRKAVYNGNVEVIVEGYTYPYNGTITKKFTIANNYKFWSNSSKVTIKSDGLSDVYIDINGIKTLKPLDMLVVIPQTYCNITVAEYSSSKVRFTASAPSGEVVTFTISGLKPNAKYGIYVDGVQRDIVRISSDGVLTFTWSDWSSHSFEITLITEMEYYMDALIGLIIAGIMVFATFVIGGMVLGFTDNPVLRMIVVGGMGLAMLALITYFIMTVS